MQTQITDYHAKYYAYELSRIGGSGFDRIGRALFDACVDLNPHQIEAALFALRSPIAKGALLADEVGLGKTIEAGLVLCQYWAERRRSLLVICPASIRKQWAMELSEKFNLHYIILDAKTFKTKLSIKSVIFSVVAGKHQQLMNSINFNKKSLLLSVKSLVYVKKYLILKTRYMKSAISLLML